MIAEWIDSASIEESMVFGRRREETQPEGRYYAELIEGVREIGASTKREAKKSGYTPWHEAYRDEVQASLNRGNGRGWKLMHIASPATTLTFVENESPAQPGFMSPMLLIWDTES